MQQHVYSPGRKLVSACHASAFLLMATHIFSESTSVRTMHMDYKDLHSGSLS